MANVIEINWRPDDRTLRQFGFIALAGFGFVAALAWFEALVFSFGLGEARVPVAAGFAALGVVSGLLSLVYPRANLPIYLGITIATYPIGFVLSYVLMGTLFYLIVAPVGLVMRLFGKDPLEHRIKPDATTYWVDSPPARASASYFRQF
jgi:MFS family permease